MAEISLTHRYAHRDLREALELVKAHGLHVGYVKAQVALEQLEAKARAEAAGFFPGDRVVLVAGKKKGLLGTVATDSSHYGDRCEYSGCASPGLLVPIVWDGSEDHAWDTCSTTFERVP